VWALFNLIGIFLVDKWQYGGWFDTNSLKEFAKEIIFYTRIGRRGQFQSILEKYKDRK
jgi:hypothetical protein